MYILEELNYINSFLQKSYNHRRFSTFIEFLAPWKRIIHAKKHYLDLFKKLLIKNIQYVTAVFK